MLSFKNVHFHYESGMSILDQFSLEVKLPSKIALVGPSGIGKTTLLNLLAGIISPTSGEVAFEGKQISSPHPERIIVFQNYPLLPWKNVRQNIALALLNSDLGESEKELRISEVLKLVKLEGFEFYYPSQLSGGMKQRVGLARAIAARPRLLLLDEPFAGLDALTRMELTSELYHLLLHHSVSSVLVTHNIEEALYLCDEVYVVNERPLKIVGRFPGLKSEKSFLEVKQSEAFRTAEIAIHQLLK